MSTLESPRYQAEQERLEHDPAIIAMAAEVADGATVKPLSDSDMEGWDFIRSAHYEAHRRGVRAESVGGPARAIRAIIRAQRAANSD